MSCRGVYLTDKILRGMASVNTIRKNSNLNNNPNLKL